MTSAARNGRLAARPRGTGRAGSPTGRQTVTADGAHAVLYVPDDYDGSRPLALVVTLHGAGGSAERGLQPLLPLADDHGLILLSPQARGSTWDGVLGRFGPDVAAVDRLLEETFARYAVDPARVAVSGFSDGASYALSLGLTNGDLFNAVIAFSPGFAATREAHGFPRVFVSHGTDDHVLPIDATSRRGVPELRRRGYDVTYREFSGGHYVPPAMAREAVRWLLLGPANP